MIQDRARNIRDRIKNGISVSPGDVAHLALIELERSTTAIASSMIVADHHIKRAEAYARIAQSLRSK